MSTKLLAARFRFVLKPRSVLQASFFGHNERRITSSRRTSFLEWLRAAAHLFSCLHILLWLWGFMLPLIISQRLMTDICGIHCTYVVNGFLKLTFKCFMSLCSTCDTWCAVLLMHMDTYSCMLFRNDKCSYRDETLLRRRYQREL